MEIDLLHPAQATAQHSQTSGRRKRRERKEEELDLAQILIE